MLVWVLGHAAVLPEADMQKVNLS